MKFLVYRSNQQTKREKINMTIKKNISKEQGQALVELATSLVVLMTLLAGVVDFGRAFFTYVALRDAAQEGASYASVAATDALDDTNLTGYCQGIANRVRITTTDFSGNVATSPINLETLIADHDVSVETEIDGTECSLVTPADICHGALVSVKVSYGSFPVTMPFMGTILGAQNIALDAVVHDTILTPACQ
jgi:hypothetical protein